MIIFKTRRQYWKSLAIVWWVGSVVNAFAGDWWGWAFYGLTGVACWLESR